MSAILAFVAIFLVSCVSLSGALIISINKTKLSRILFYFVSFATGAILGTTFLDLMPETQHLFETLMNSGASIPEWAPYMLMLIGFFMFYVLDHFLHAVHTHNNQKNNLGHNHHHHEDEKPHQTAPSPDCAITNDPESCLDASHPHELTFFNLIGDGLHNFLDGIIIMVAFMQNTSAGVVITVAVILHEFPQEIGDFSILLYGGMPNKKALGWNFASGLVAIIGGLFAYFLSSQIVSFNAVFMAISAGGFLYIAAVKLMPELMRESNQRRSGTQALMFVLGLILMISLILLLPHEH